MTKYRLDDRIEPLVTHRPNITIKDHIENVITNPTVRLSCPNSSDIVKLINEY